MVKKKNPKEIVHEMVREEIKKGTIRIETFVKDVMTKDVMSVKPEENLRRVLTLSSEYGITGFPVIEKNKILGVVSQTDIMKIMGTKNILDAKKDEIKLSELERITVRDVMTKRPIMIDQDEKITDASELMSKHDVNRLLVVDRNNRLVGIVTREDIMKAMTTEFFVKSLQLSGEAVVKTNIDDLLDIIKEKKSINIKDLSKKLKVNPEQIEEWGRILEERGLIEMEYPAIGLPRLREKR